MTTNENLLGIQQSMLPIFKGENYEFWAIKMKTLFKSLKLWDLVENGYVNENDEQSEKQDKDAKALFIIQSAVHETIFARIAEAGNSTHAWRIIKHKYQRLPEILQEEGEEYNEGQPEGTLQYLPLHKAILRGDWESAKRFFEQDRSVVACRIDSNSSLPIHVAIASRQSIHFINKLMKLMTDEELHTQDKYGLTPLHLAARIGYTKVVVTLGERCQALLQDPTVLHESALSYNKDTFHYLLAAQYQHADAHPGAFFTGDSGLGILINLIHVRLLDEALALLKYNPDLATLQKLISISERELAGRLGRNVLSALALNESEFQSGSDLNVFERLIYSCVPVKFYQLDNLKNSNRNEGDIENRSDNSEMFLLMRGSALKFHLSHLCQKPYLMLWDAIKLLVPHIKDIQNAKVMHHAAVRLVEILCQKIISLNNAKTCRRLLENPLFEATKRDIPEIAETILNEYPRAARYKRNNHNLLYWAIQYRSEKIFNLVEKMTNDRSKSVTFVDQTMNTILHLAGNVAPPNKLKLIPGAALQMQYELKWFKKVEMSMSPFYRNMVNQFHETPAMVFTKEHKQLVNEGDKWMKDTASSCTIAAALTATIAFSAAITVPGGNDGNTGFPIFGREKSFIFFVIADAISLFTSTTSLLIFLSILTSRYAESDFLLILPRRLIIGLVALFLSVTTMMMAFSAALYLLFEQRNIWWLLVPAVALACLPVTSFVLLQFPLLVDVIRWTYSTDI